MQYTKWYLTRALVYQLVATLFLGALVGGTFGGQDAVIGFGLAGLIIGGLSAVVMVLAALVVFLAKLDTTFNPRRGSGDEVLDGNPPAVIVTHQRRAGTYLLTALILILIGGSLCLGSISIGDLNLDTR